MPNKVKHKFVAKNLVPVLEAKKKAPAKKRDNKATTKQQIAKMVTKLKEKVKPFTIVVGKKSTEIIEVSDVSSFTSENESPDVPKVTNAKPQLKKPAPARPAVAPTTNPVANTKKQQQVKQAKAAEEEFKEVPGLGFISGKRRFWFILCRASHISRYEQFLENASPKGYRVQR